MFKDNLLSILDELKGQEDDREVFYQHCIEKRLNQSLQTYYHEIQKSIKYLDKKDELRVLRKMNKES